MSVAVPIQKGSQYVYCLVVHTKQKLRTVAVHRDLINLLSIIRMNTLCDEALFRRHLKGLRSEHHC